MTQTYGPPPSPLVNYLAEQLRPHDGARRPPRTGELAVLRRQARNLGRLDPQAAALVYRLVGAGRVSQDAGMLTACLWATWHQGYDHPVNADGVNIGAALRRVDPQQAQRLFEALATATAPTLPTRLHHTIVALAKAGVGLDWRQTHHDIRRFMAGDAQRVLRRWASGLYNNTPITQPDTKETEES